MPWRLFLTVTALVAIALAVVAVLERFLALYQTLAALSPWLAGGVVAVLAFALALAVWVVVRYFGILPRSHKSVPPKVSANAAHAAEQQLTALEAQLQQIEDTITRQALADQAKHLRQELRDRPVQVVVFGVGSAGKTSLVNAMLQSGGGLVSAEMGTTPTVQFYPPVKVGNLPEIIWVDCPGILEAGALGRQREEEARTIATQADLLLFVIDEDLKQTELEILQSICTIGKRVVLVFNKSDRYLPADLEIILAQLRQKLAPYLAPSDIVAISARPAPVPLPSGELVQPPPRLTALIERLSAILQQERQQLLADNVLLKSQHLTEQTQAILNQQRQTQARQVIEKYQWWVVGAVLATPLPALDVLATAAIHTQMVIEIGKIYGCSIDTQQGRELANSLTRTVVSLGIVKGVSRIVSTMISITVVGVILRSAIQAITGAYLTHIAGESFIDYFSRNQDWGDGGITAVVQRQFQLDRRREFMETFVKSALQRILTLN
ncbi:MAG: YcjF family protein [Pseudanabaenaceae cyanobacterium]